MTFDTPSYKSMTILSSNSGVFHSLRKEYHSVVIEEYSFETPNLENLFFRAF